MAILRAYATGSRCRSSSTIPPRRRRREAVLSVSKELTTERVMWPSCAEANRGAADAPLATDIPGLRKFVSIHFGEALARTHRSRAREGERPLYIERKFKRAVQVTAAFVAVAVAVAGC